MYITCGKKNGAQLLPKEAPLFLPQNRYNQLQPLPKITSGFWVLP